MAYQALYRKWRPAVFEDVYGQDAIVTTLKNQITSGRIGHAYLFCGTRGTGKTTLAKIFARAANCEHAAEHGGSPCNECPVCRSILSESSMNVFEIDAASNNSVEDIRRIREEVAYPPTEGRYKVYIIDEVHMLSTSAFNALLKTLEEPPSYVIFILATTDPQKVPQTILSRCQRYDLKRIKSDVIAARLRELSEAEGRKVEDRAIDYIARTADGSMRDALSLLDRCFSFMTGQELSYKDTLEVLGASDTSVFSGLYRSLCSGDVEGALRAVSDTVAAGREIYQFTNDFIWYLRNVLLCMSTRDASDLLDASEENIDRLREDAVLTDKAFLIEMMSRMAELSNRLRFARDKRTLLEVELIRLSTREPAKPSGEQRGIQDRPASQRASQPREELPKPEVRNTAEGTEAKIKAAVETVPPKGTSGAEEAGPQEAEAREAEPAVTAAVREKAEAYIPDGTEASKASSAAGQADRMQVLRENWSELVSQLSMSNRHLYENAFLKEEEERPMVIFKSSMGFRLASTNKEENGLTRLSELCRDQLGLELRFGGRVARRGEMEKEADRITDEELARINFPVDIEQP